MRFHPFIPRKLVAWIDGQARDVFRCNFFVLHGSPCFTICGILSGGIIQCGAGMFYSDGGVTVVDVSGALGPQIRSYAAFAMT